MTHLCRWLSPMVIVIAVAGLVSPFHGSAQAQDAPTSADLWDDFNHYTLIARHDLATSSGQALLASTTPEELLDIVEASDYSDYEKTLEAATRHSELAPIAVRIDEALLNARIERAREPMRIQEDIERLTQGQRAYTNAVRRLRAAGQYAVPQLLESLQSKDDEALRPYVTTALVAMGRQAVYPLSVALPSLEGPTQQRVALILAEIGYPMPLPFIKDVIEDSETSPEVVATLQAAYDRLASQINLTEQVSATDLYIILSQAQYDAHTMGQTRAGFDVVNGNGLLWRYNQNAGGLVPIETPESIFGDALAMQSSKLALELSPDSDQALRMWLMANIRRELSLKPGEQDPTYSSSLKPASYYAMLAGPDHLLRILAQSIHDDQADVALAVLQALGTTASTDKLTVDGAAVAPMLASLLSPVRKVRFEAAAVLATVRPESTYEGADLVVPALAQAVLTQGDRFAVVLSADQLRAAEVIAQLETLGYKATGVQTIEEAKAISEELPAVDVMVSLFEGADVPSVIEMTQGDPRLAATPIMAMASQVDRVRLDELSRDMPRLIVLGETSSLDVIREALETATSRFGAGALDDFQAEFMAMYALYLLRDIGVGSPVYDLSLAQPALISALSDQRDSVAAAAAEVTSMLPSAAAQKALAEAAFEQFGERQIVLLNALARSATHFGNQLSASQNDEIAKLVAQSTGDTALAAAQAHGALGLPTQSAVELIMD